MKLAIFDFDGTLFPQQTIPFFMKYYTQENYPKGPYVKYQMKILSKMLKYKNPLIKNYGKEQFRREAALLFIQVFNGMDQVILDKFLLGVAEDVIQNLSEVVVREIKQCKTEGYCCVLLSGCYTPILESVARAVGVDVVIGTPIESVQSCNEKVCIGDLDIATGKRKVQKLLEVFKNKDINWQDSTAYGDSSYDRNILELVGKPVAVGPDEGLRELAIENSWRIIE